MHTITITSILTFYPIRIGSRCQSMHTVASAGVFTLHAIRIGSGSYPMHTIASAGVLTLHAIGVRGRSYPMHAWAGTVVDAIYATVATVGLTTHTDGTFAENANVGAVAMHAIATTRVLAQNPA